jgi:hypothetical protein
MGRMPFMSRVSPILMMSERRERSCPYRRVVGAAATMCQVRVNRLNWRPQGIRFKKEMFPYLWPMGWRDQGKNEEIRK